MIYPRQIEVIMYLIISCTPILSVNTTPNGCVLVFLMQIVLDLFGPVIFKSWNNCRTLVLF